MGVPPREHGRRVKFIAVLAFFAPLGSVVSGCADRVPAPSEIAPYAFAASDYLYSSQRERNDAGETYDEIVARCMKEQGFDYRAPTSPASTEVDQRDDASMFALPDAAVSGYGVVFPFSEFGTGNDGPNTDDADDHVDIYRADESMAGMTPAAVDAYTRALYGTYGDDRIEDPEATWDWTRAGCSGQADHELTTAAAAGTIANPYEALMEEILKTPEHVFDASEWREAITVWSECVHDAGHGRFQSIDEPMAAISHDRDALLAPEQLPHSDENLLSVTDDRDGVPDRMEWEALRKREISLASDDDRCRAAADLDGTYARAYSLIERRFVHENREDLERMMVWVSEHPR
ncbi:MAG: hypothetical protein AAGC61_08645 [Microbacterium sp.]